MTWSDRRWKQSEADYVGTLVYLDEPQVVLLDHGNDAKIIGVAIERDGFQFPFLGAEISFSQLQRYHREFVDLRYLFLMPRWKRWFLFDLAEKGNGNAIKLMPATAEVYKDDNNLPAAGFFARDHTHSFPGDPIAKLSKQTYLIDGAWSPYDLSTFFGRINDLYSFFIGLTKFNGTSVTELQKRELLQAFTAHSLRGGSSYVGFYGDLKHLLGIDERLAMGGIRKESPGYVDVEGKAEILAEVVKALQNYSCKIEDINARYRELRSYLKTMGLLKEDPDRFEKGGAVANYIRTLSIGLADSLNVDYSTIEVLTSHHELLSAKILLSHCRRLERYNLFFAEGRVQLPETESPVVNSPSMSESSLIHPDSL